MKTIAYAFVTVFLLCANTTAAIKIDSKIVRNMDDVQSLGVIYINHNFSTVHETGLAVHEDADQHGAKYYHTILMGEPGSNGSMHTSADIYR